MGREHLWVVKTLVGDGEHNLYTTVAVPKIIIS